MIRLKQLVLVFLAVFLASSPLYAAPTIITMMQFHRGEEAEWQQEVVDMFNERYDNIQVELVAVPDLRPYEKAIAMWAAGMPPHISYGDPYHTIGWGLEGLALDLEPFFQRDLEDTDFVDFFPNVIDMHRADGKLFGIPIDLQVQAFFYAEYPFDEAGLAYPDENWTWDKVEEESRRLTVIDGDGEVQRHAMRDPQWLHWWSVLWHFGAEFVDDPKQPTQFIGDSPEMQQALSWFHRMIQENNTMPLVQTGKGSTAQNMLVEENVAMAIGSSLYQQEANQYAIDVPWNVTFMPSGPAGNTAFANALGWTVFRDAGDHEEVWEVLKFFSSAEAMQLAVEMRGILVPHIPSTRDIWLRYNSVPENRQVFVEAVNTARTLPVLYDNVLDAVQTNVTAYWNGLLPLTQAIENMRSTVMNWIESH